MTRTKLLEVCGEFGGAVGGWRPAITGTLNQTGRDDYEASLFDNETDLAEAVALCRAENAPDLRITIVEEDDR